MRKPFLRNPLVSKLSQLWQDHCTKFLEVIQRNNRNLLDVEYMWGLEQKWNALCPFYIYCDYFQIITSGKLSWINFWYKALILNSFPNDLLQATTITTKKQLLRNYWGRKAGTWKMNFELLYKWINTEWNLMLYKCFSLLCNRMARPNLSIALWTVSCQRSSLNLQNKMALNGLLVPIVHMDDFWIFFGRSMLGFPGVPPHLTGSLLGRYSKAAGTKAAAPPGIVEASPGSDWEQGTLNFSGTMFLSGRFALGLYFGRVSSLLITWENQAVYSLLSWHLVQADSCLKLCHWRKMWGKFLFHGKSCLV